MLRKIIFAAMLGGLAVVRNVLEKKLTRNFGANCFLCMFFSRFQFTCDVHDALQQKNSKSFYFYWKGILLQFWKNRIFLKNYPKFCKIVLN